MRGLTLNSIRVIATAIVFTAACGLGQREVSAACTCCVPICRPGDQVWLISTRHLPTTKFRSKRCCPCYQYYRYCPCHGWRPSSEREFLRSQPAAAINTLYVHGNRGSEQQACCNGLRVYWRIAQCAPCDRPMRHVIWSWPSDQLPCRLAVLRDVRVKYRRTISQSYYLAQWLARTQSTGCWTLMGYSYGTRTILGALQLRAGGSYSGYCLPSQCLCHGPQYRIVLLAAATQRDWLRPYGPHGCALHCVHSGLILYNPCDPVLRRFRRFILTARSPALGLFGLPCCVADAHLLCQINAAQFVGRSHSWSRYIESDCLRRCIVTYLCW